MANRWFSSKALMGLLCALSAGVCADHLSEVRDRIAPVGVASVDPESQVESRPSASRSPEVIYNAHCVACHASGIAGAPKFGDKAAWAPHVAKGMDTLLKNAISGINAMPPKGTCTTCTDEELKNTIQYMVDRAK